VEGLESVAPSFCPGSTVVVVGTEATLKADSTSAQNKHNWKDLDIKDMNAAIERGAKNNEVVI